MHSHFSQLASTSRLAKMFCLLSRRLTKSALRRYHLRIDITERTRLACGAVANQTRYTYAPRQRPLDLDVTTQSAYAVTVWDAARTINVFAQADVMHCNRQLQRSAYQHAVAYPRQTDYLV